MKEICLDNTSALEADETLDLVDWHTFYRPFYNIVQQSFSQYTLLMSPRLHHDHALLNNY